MTVHTQEKLPKGKKRWIGVLMVNGTFHVKHYLGPHNFYDSQYYIQYHESPHVEKVVGPIICGAMTDHKVILRDMLDGKRF